MAISERLWDRRYLWLAVTRGLVVLVFVIWVNLVEVASPSLVARARFDLEVLEKAAKLYRLKVGRYPRELSELTASGPKGEAILEELPPDPWGNPYVYERRGGQRPPFAIVSYGADGRPGGEDLGADLTSTDFR